MNENMKHSAGSKIPVDLGLVCRGRPISNLLNLGVLRDAALKGTLAANNNCARSGDNELGRTDSYTYIFEVLQDAMHHNAMLPNEPVNA
jgi:hypothetical protein